MPLMNPLKTRSINKGLLYSRHEDVLGPGRLEVLARALSLVEPGFKTT